MGKWIYRVFFIKIPEKTDRVHTVLIHNHHLCPQLQNTNVIFHTNQIIWTWTLYKYMYDTNKGFSYRLYVLLFSSCLFVLMKLIWTHCKASMRYKTRENITAIQAYAHWPQMNIIIQRERRSFGKIFSAPKHFLPNH